MRSGSALRLLVLGALLVSTGGCLRGCTSSRPPIHLNPNMDTQPKYRPQAESAFFYDGATMRRPVEGTVARGRLDDDPALFEGKDATGAFLAKGPLAVDEAFLARGAERYGIYCALCHGSRGNGQGMLFERGKIPVADLRQERLVAAPDGQLFDVVTNGLGLMAGYRYPIPPADRWAIVAYVRVLQSEAAQAVTTLAPGPAATDAAEPPPAVEGGES